MEWPYYSSVEWDEPLGSYSKEKLNKYTNKNLKIDISYYYGEYINEPFQPLIQIFEIYNDDKQIYFGFKLWEEEWILAEGGYTLNDQEEIIIEDEDLSEIILDPKYFVNSIIEFMSNKRKIKRGRDAWVELWGRDENGKYMCVYITSPIKREEGIEADSKVVSYYYVTIDTADNKAEEIHVKKLKK